MKHKKSKPKPRPLPRPVPPDGDPPQTAARREMDRARGHATR